MVEIKRELSTAAQLAVVLGLTACGPNGLGGYEVGITATDTGDTEAEDGSGTDGSATDTTTEAGDGSATDTTDGGEPFTQTEITRFAIGESLANCKMAVDEQGVLVEGEFECEPNTTITPDMEGIAGTEDQEGAFICLLKTLGDSKVLSQPIILLGEDGTFANKLGSGVILYDGKVKEDFTVTCADGKPAQKETATITVSPKA